MRGAARAGFFIPYANRASSGRCKNQVLLPTKAKKVKLYLSTTQGHSWTFLSSAPDAGDGQDHATTQGHSWAFLSSAPDAGDGQGHATTQGHSWAFLSSAPDAGDGQDHATTQGHSWAFLSSAPDAGHGQDHDGVAVVPGKNPSTNRIRGKLDPRAGVSVLY